MSSTKFNILIALVLPVVSVSSQENSYKKILQIENCDKIYTLACFKLDMANCLDKFQVNTHFNIIPGVSFWQSPSSVKVHTSTIAEEVAREYPEDLNSRVDHFLYRKLGNFLSNYSLKLNFSDLAQEEARKSQKGDGGMAIVVIAGATLIGVIASLTLGGLTALAGKALLTGAVSFVLSTVIGLKQLTSTKHKIYYGQPVPIYTSDAHDGWNGYVEHSRNRDDIVVSNGLSNEVS